MDELLIGEAARRCGVAPSALRYYEERGLVRPDRRVAGQRRYGRAALRRVVFIRIGQELGLSLEEIAVLLDADVQTWRAESTRHIADLDAQLARLRAARAMLAHGLTCPSTHPASECRYLLSELDSRLAEPARAGAEQHPPQAPPVS